MFRSTRNLPFLFKGTSYQQGIHFWVIITTKLHKLCPLTLTLLWRYFNIAWISFYVFTVRYLRTKRSSYHLRWSSVVELQVYLICTSMNSQIKKFTFCLNLFQFWGTFTKLWLFHSSVLLRTMLIIDIIFVLTPQFKYIVSITIKSLFFWQEMTVFHRDSSPKLGCTKLALDQPGYLDGFIIMILFVIEFIHTHPKSGYLKWQQALLIKIICGCWNGCRAEIINLQILLFDSLPFEMICHSCFTEKCWGT